MKSHLLDMGGGDITQVIVTLREEYQLLVSVLTHGIVCTLSNLCALSNTANTKEVIYGSALLSNCSVIDMEFVDSDLCTVEVDRRGINGAR